MIAPYYQHTLVALNHLLYLLCRLLLRLLYCRLGHRLMEQERLLGKAMARLCFHRDRYQHLRVLGRCRSFWRRWSREGLRRRRLGWRLGLLHRWRNDGLRVWRRVWLRREFCPYLRLGSSQQGLEVWKGLRWRLRLGKIHSTIVQRHRRVLGLLMYLFRTDMCNSRNKFSKDHRAFTYDLRVLLGRHGQWQRDTRRGRLEEVEVEVL